MDNNKTLRMIKHLFKVDPYSKRPIGRPRKEKKVKVKKLRGRPKTIPMEIQPPKYKLEYEGKTHFCKTLFEMSEITGRSHICLCRILNNYNSYKKLSSQTLKDIVISKLY
jgi:hypothetical protein